MLGAKCPTDTWGLDISLPEYDLIAYLLISNQIAIALGQKSLPLWGAKAILS
jgi:hypothetical protein